MMPGPSPFLLASSGQLAKIEDATAWKTKSCPGSQRLFVPTTSLLFFGGGGSLNLTSIIIPPPTRRQLCPPLQISQTGGGQWRRYDGFILFLLLILLCCYPLLIPKPPFAAFFTIPSRIPPTGDAECRRGKSGRIGKEKGKRIPGEERREEGRGILPTSASWPRAFSASRIGNEKIFVERRELRLVRCAATWPVAG
ncbi:hypothetical protein GQ53DRAFT_340153 [Thozetella sp. PMI_491]|nr:hypothetical protein GQ53DRAFT_340153 [Thozetella sp. PMI_491]